VSGGRVEGVSNRIQSSLAVPANARRSLVSAPAASSTGRAVDAGVNSAVMGQEDGVVVRRRHEAVLRTRGQTAQRRGGMEEVRRVHADRLHGESRDQIGSEA